MTSNSNCGRTDIKEGNLLEDQHPSSNSKSLQQYIFQTIIAKILFKLPINSN